MKINLNIILGISLFTFSANCQVPIQKADSLKRMMSVASKDTVKVNLLNKVADLFKEINPDSTTFYADKALLIATPLKYTYGIGNAEINKGNANIILGNYPAALIHFLKAQNQFENLVSEYPTEKSYNNCLARSYASAGVVYSEQSNHYMALEAYQKALKIYQENKQHSNISKALNNIGIVYKAQQDNDKALVYFKKAYQIQQEIAERNAPVTLTNIGVIYFEAHNYQLALRYYNMAEKQFSKMDNKRGYALLNNYFGDYYTKQKDS
ncbi:MAG TPA: tetratricopeptide repeat protein, partial [Flavobacterium sp.]